MNPDHAKIHQAENQTLRGERQLPWRRGWAGLVIPTLTLVGVAALAIVVWVTI
ncbi:MAG TPA: hypothetical protein VK906_10660 [Egicoccus sp.]|nr:hypothetical protein [Egicoccus sp.]HSK23630.1 hypothetical protein [Egicoccus sp.]